MRDSSLEAYELIQDKLGKAQKQVLKVIQDAPNPISDREISIKLGWTINRVTGRRKELENKEKIESVGRMLTPHSKIKVHHWVKKV